MPITWIETPQTYFKRIVSSFIQVKKERNMEFHWMARRTLAGVLFFLFILFFLSRKSDETTRYGPIKRGRNKGFQTRSRKGEKERE